MIFNQLEFLFLFLPAAALAFYMPGLRRFRIPVLVILSVFFYGLSGQVHALVLCFDIVWVWLIARPGSRLRLGLAIAGPVLGLLYFKYSGFMFASVGLGGFFEASAAGQLLAQNLLPAGISFFTFQIVGYAIDRYRGEAGASFGVFAFFVSFFPQLVAGPIVRFGEIRDQIRALPSFVPTYERVLRCVMFVSVGLLLKVGFADNLSAAILRYGIDPTGLSSAAAWFAVFAYSYQIYFDFFGYSLIAVGLGHLFGIRLPENFRLPYLSASPREFWRRWHITLSYWIRDYLYLPLGGNRSYFVNITLVFAVCGLWHGASWTYVAWGLFHAGLVCGYGLVAHGWDRMPRGFRIGMTFMLVSLGWTFFRYDFVTSAEFMVRLVDFGRSGPIPSIGDLLLLAASALLACIVSHAALEKCLHFRGGRAAVFQTGLAAAFVLSLFMIDTSQSFIYFRF